MIYGPTCHAQCNYLASCKIIYLLGLSLGVACLCYYNNSLKWGRDSHYDFLSRINDTDSAPSAVFIFFLALLTSVQNCAGSEESEERDEHYSMFFVDVAPMLPY
ncbi:UNVERIFIED_CONTAM: hypothetical protein NCL1_39063 [Trichonephila clavipes]